MDFTTFADTARYTAHLAIDDGDVPLPEHFAIAGDMLDFHGLVAAYEGASGKRLTVERRGSLKDLDGVIQQRLRDAPQDMVAWLPLMYYRAMLSGKGKLGELSNHRYPQLRPTTVADYVRTQQSL